MVLDTKKWITAWGLQIGGVPIELVLQTSTTCYNCLHTHSGDVRCEGGGHQGPEQPNATIAPQNGAVVDITPSEDSCISYREM